MGRCRATTRKGTRCRNEASSGSRFCGVHAGAAEAAGTGREGAAGGREGARDGAGSNDPFRELGETTRTVLGFAAVGLVVLFGITIGRRF